MSLKFLTIMPVITTCAAAVVISFAPNALADNNDCVDTGGATVCGRGDIGDSSIVVDDPSQGVGGQNGMYGPAGDSPPVGSN